MLCPVDEDGNELRPNCPSGFCSSRDPNRCCDFTCVPIAKPGDECFVEDMKCPIEETSCAAPPCGCQLFESPPLTINAAGQCCRDVCATHESPRLGDDPWATPTRPPSGTPNPCSADAKVCDSSTQFCDDVVGGGMIPPSDGSFDCLPLKSQGQGSYPITMLA